MMPVCIAKDPQLESKAKLNFAHLKDPFYSKKGVAITLRSPGVGKNGKKVHGTYLTNMPKVEKLNVGWNYSWGNKLQPTQPEKTSFAGMVYGVYGNPPLDKVTENLKKAVAPVAERQKQAVLLGYNEPDRESQSNVSVEKALKYWKALEAVGVPLCSPSTVHPDNDWMKRFMKGVEKQNLRVDYIGVHDYGGGNAEQFKKKLKRIHKMYGNRPLIITEFAVADWSAKSLKENRHSKKQVMKFMKEILPWMDKQDWIVGYAWFPFSQKSNVGHPSALFNEKGDLTELGKLYAKHRSR